MSLTLTGEASEKQICDFIITTTNGWHWSGDFPLLILLTASIPQENKSKGTENDSIKKNKIKVTYLTGVCSILQSNNPLNVNEIC